MIERLSFVDEIALFEEALLDDSADLRPNLGDSKRAYPAGKNVVGGDDLGLNLYESNLGKRALSGWGASSAIVAAAHDEEEGKGAEEGPGHTRRRARGHTAAPNACAMRGQDGVPTAPAIV